MLTAEVGHTTDWALVATLSRAEAIAVMPLAIVAVLKVNMCS